MAKQKAAVEDIDRDLEAILGENYTGLAERVAKIKSIVYKRQKAKLQEIFNMLRFKYEGEIDRMRQTENLKMTSNQFLEDSIQMSNASKTKLKAMFR